MFQTLINFYSNLEKAKESRIKNIFICSVISWSILHTTILIPVIHILFNPQNTSTISDFSVLKYYNSLILTDVFINFYLMFIIGQLCSGFLYLFYSKNILLLILFHFFTLNINNRQPTLLDGGNNIMQLMLGYSILIQLSALNAKNLIFQQTLNTISNLGLLVVRIQVCIVYFTAGVCKLQGELWTNGSALFYILQNRDYSHPFLINNLYKSITIPLLSINAYIIILFQISFCFLIWFKQTKNMIIFIGIIFHLFIAFFMGLPMFGLAMILTYTCFIQENDLLFFYEKLIRNTPLTVAFDNNCSICIKFSKFLNFLDTKRLIIIDSANSPQNKNFLAIPSNIRINEISSIDINSNYFFGFETIVQIFLRIRILRLFLPLMYLLKYLNLDRKLYLLFSQSHIRKKCRDNQCAL